MLNSCFYWWLLFFSVGQWRLNIINVNLSKNDDEDFDIIFDSLNLMFSITEGDFMILLLL
jgi:hypothetical protein